MFARQPERANGASVVVEEAQNGVFVARENVQTARWKGWRAGIELSELELEVGGKR